MNRHSIVAYVANALNTNIELIDGAKTIKHIEKSIQNQFEQGRKVVAVANVLPLNNKYLSMQFCGENFMVMGLPYKITVWNDDFGVAFVYNMPSDPISKKPKFTGTEDLIKAFNATNQPEQLIINKDIKVVEVEEEPKEKIDYSEYSDDDLKGLYKELKGSHYRGKFTREGIIKKINELS